MPSYKFITMQRLQSEYLFDPEINAGKMIFLSGPRQVGKTFLVKSRLAETGGSSFYFNWDDPLVRRGYVRNPHFLKAPLAQTAAKPQLVAFDEIHKHKGWKNILKGLYDLHSGEAQFIVTGSARLDYFKASGDSLVGRYFSFRLLPLGLAEAAEDCSAVINEPEIFAAPGRRDLLSRLPTGRRFKEAFAFWLRFGGFPEPFLKAKESFSIKWRRDYRSLLTTEDLRDLTRIHDLKGIEQLMLILPEKIGSPLSVNSLREDLQVNHKTVTNWLDAFKKIYLMFSIMPYAKSISRALVKESKYYFYDWTMVDDEGIRFENAVAVSLLRLVNRWNEFGLGDFDLRYIRNAQKQEVDFVIVNGTRPLALFEAKVSAAALSPACRFFADTLNVPCYQLVARAGEEEVFPDNRFVLPAWRMLAALG
jgi:predicted AAA+ superfamily ATPase